MLKVAILDMQPIDPPIGGGRLRLLGLYHALGPDIEATYVGTFDWRGETARDQRLTTGLREVLVPLSKAHHAAAARLSRLAGGRTVIDAAFAQQAALSKAYLARAREAVAQADVVVYSHPWLHPLTADLLKRDRQLVIYDAHNCEGALRLSLLDDGGAGTQIAREVVRLEHRLCHAADLILACAPQDGQAFTRLYGVSPGKVRLVPNGAFTEGAPAGGDAERAKARARLGLDEKPLAVFLGSAYPPNREAARFILDDLAPRRPEMRFAVLGGVGSGLVASTPAPALVTGPLTEGEKQDWLTAADLAINPMFGGSGTNIKMLEFMAAGLPIVTTPVGARGIETTEPAFVVAERAEFAEALAALSADQTARRRLARTAVDEVRRLYSWERLSPRLGGLMARAHERLGRRPAFSVLVPTYGRHAQLSTLVACLARQTFRDFELIIVDQSEAPWQGASQDHGFDLLYVRTDVRGAVHARNRAAELASAPILAFLDDDTQPSLTWLEAAARHFEREASVGLEGLIVSDAPGPERRTVTNDAFDGIGFMTANLFVRADVFRHVGGFDPAFDCPHFREDTDLGWRIEALGPVPFSREALVYHPAACRADERESLESRSRFFMRDARLLRKHPARYPELFRREAQWRHNPHFLRYFAEGLRMERMQAPAEIVAIVRRDGVTWPDIADSSPAPTP